MADLWTDGRLISFSKTKRALLDGSKDVTRRVSVRRERLDAITDDDVRREGFPHMDAAAFIEFFVRELKGAPDRVVTRIEFKVIWRPAEQQLSLLGGAHAA